MRKDMPVIDNRDIRLLQKRLSSGTIDISRPFADNTVPNDPFCTRIRYTNRKRMGNRLLRMMVMQKGDVVKVKMKSVAVGQLKPIQKQIYFDKSIKKCATRVLKEQ